MGPGQLTIPPLESCCVPCQVDFCQSEPEGIIMVEASDATPLPQGVMLQPVVATVKAMDPNVSLCCCRMSQRKR